MPTRYQELDCLIKSLQWPSEENVIIESLINKFVYKSIMGMTYNFLICFLFGDVQWFLQLGQISPLYYFYEITLSIIQIKLYMITKLNKKNTSAFLHLNIFSEW